MDKGTVVVWSVAIFCAAAVVLSPVACTMRQKELIADSIKAGADPIAVRCALESSTSDSRTSSMCLMKTVPK